MANRYNNIPILKTITSSNSTQVALENFYEGGLPVNVAAYDAMRGYFESRGFSSQSADVIAAIMFYQADIDGYNPFSVLDNLKGLNEIELNLLVTEILNFNRFKTSFLGLTATYSTQPEVQREILP